jgi:uncharacterized protein (DUF1810 family)
MAHELHRFVEAQSPVYDQVLSELKAGKKTTHWIWYIFPQLAGLGSSQMARRYAIQSCDEARAYLAHPLLGARLMECTAALNSHERLAAREILGDVDATKVRSCMTLFAHVAGDHSAFHRTLEKYYSGEADALTLSLL